MAEYIKDGMVLHATPQWFLDDHGGVEEEGKGDALWRLALYYIATGEGWAKESILSMLELEVRYFGPNVPVKGYPKAADVSRDQWQMAMMSLYINKDPEFYEVKVPRFMLGTRTRMGSELYHWAKYMQTGKIRHAIMYNIRSFLWLKIANFWDGVVYNALEDRLWRFRTEIELKDVQFVWGEEWDWFKDKEAKLYPMYARHLRSWRNYVMNKKSPNIVWSKNRYMTLKYVSPQNKVLMMLNGLVDVNWINEPWQPRKGYVWQDRFDTFSVGNMHKMDEEPGIHMDRLVYNFLRDENKGKMDRWTTPILEV